MARTLQDLLRVTNGVAPDVRKAPSPFDNLPQGVGLKPGGGQPFGIPLSPGALGDKVSSQPGGSPFREMGRFAGGTPLQASRPIADARRTLSAPNPFEAYGGAFGGVNQNDLYRRPAPPAAGPNGMMGPAPTNDFNAMAGSQVGGQGAALAAKRPWEGVFSEGWRSSTDSEFRQLAEAGKRGGASLFGNKPPRNPDGSQAARLPFNPQTGVSGSYPGAYDPWGQGFGLSGAERNRLAASAEYMPSGMTIQDYYAALSPEELAKAAASKNLSATHRKVLEAEQEKRKG